MQRFPTNPDKLPDPVTLVDDEGTHWLLHRRRLDIRAVKRLIKDVATPVVWGTEGGIDPRATGTSERTGMWELVKDAYAGPGGGGSGRYLAHEFRTGAGLRMLYVEEHC
ncbi:hypothetical protein [Yinghuangia seranimata]|uniref:hypothetical protein n=1 Tax=Yinghuangia seranimata TaxID=408067 RepID=UPI00248AA26A|nr:hypothetical protein [Yinghuangia seranimata]MDI2129625.1 hypothetical protein [Yinghuangia seranimata]